MKLILGTVQFGLDYGINNSVGKPNEEEVQEIFNLAHQTGITLLDTAEVYGNAHQLIGNFHRKYRTKKFKVITKLPHQFNEGIIDKVKTYLNELAVEEIDTLMFHSFVSYVKYQDEISGLEKLLTTGEVRRLGVSVYTNEEMNIVLGDDRIEVIQLPFNLFDNLIQRGELLAKAKAKGKIIHTRSAFLQGLFFKDVDSSETVVKKMRNELEQINQIAIDAVMPIANLALKYVLQQNLIDKVLIGVDNTTQLLQNISIANRGELNYETMEKIDSLKVSDANLLNPSLWSQVQ
jgi:aryl-alcohol dehydrogenase-like predicted oxidoreductase